MGCHGGPWRGSGGGKGVPGCLRGDREGTGWELKGIQVGLTVLPGREGAGGVLGGVPGWCREGGGGQTPGEAGCSASL